MLKKNASRLMFRARGWLKMNKDTKRPGAVAILPRPPFTLDAAEPVDLKKLEVLVIRRSKFVASPGALCFPGGGVERGETPEQTVKREFKEEVGLDVRVGRFLAENKTPTGGALYWFVAEECSNDPDLKITIQPEEVENYEWRTLVELLDDKDFLENNKAIVQKIVDGEITLR